MGERGETDGAAPVVTRRPRDGYRVEHLTDGRVAVIRRPGVSWIFDTAEQAERFLCYLDERDAGTVVEQRTGEEIV